MHNLSELWAIAPMAWKQFTSGMKDAKQGDITGQSNPRMLPMTITESGVAVIHVDGIMVKRADAFGRGGVTGSDEARMAVEAAVRDTSIKGILLRLYSPGGSVEGLGELADAVFEARRMKSVIAQVDGMAASAAYFVGSQADAVYANHATDIVGSIGTIMYTYDVSKMFEAEGIEPVVISTGVHKGAGIFGTKITDEQRAEWQKLVDFYGAAFVKAVRRGRNMKMDDVLALADGRVWPASEAVSLGLIDGIRPIEKTLANFARSANVRKSRARAQVMGMDLSSKILEKSS